ncbi:MAG: anhydro-N-acetylmuramic acid kinase [Rhodospirillales bacterium]
MGQVRQPDQDKHPIITAIGLMSGTSMDGIDAALIETDGQSINRFGPVVHTPYDELFRLQLRALLGRKPDQAPAWDETIKALTEKHAAAVQQLLDENDLAPGDIDIIGFHGHTVLHQPDAGKTYQIGDGALLARLTGIAVVNDLRQADMAAGGQGAPLAPLYHCALADEIEKPLAVLNVGGVANVTWIGNGDAILAFDTGPGNALIDDWVQQTIQQPYDTGGRLARSGTVNQDVLSTLLSHPYFKQEPPKSLDRLDFSIDASTGLSPEDGAATLTALTAEAVRKSCAFFPAQPKRWLVCGGGRHNETLMDLLTDALNVPVEPVEAVGWMGDALEAQAFGLFAVRSLYGLALTVPGTTGVSAPTTGGVLHKV